MPRCFRHPSAPADTTYTSYVGITGANTPSALGQKEGVRIREFSDGTANTLLLLEAKTQIPWTKPEDIIIENTDGKPDAKIASKKCVPHGGQVVFSKADGSVRELDVGSDSEAWQTFLKLVTRNGREVLPLSVR